MTCVALLAARAPSQQQFNQLSTHAIPDAEGTLGKCRVGDVDGDGDGDLDLQLTAVSAQDRLYLNEGDSMFVDVTAQAMPADNGWTTHAGFVDVDRDGDLDLTVAVQASGGPAADRLWLNDRRGFHTDAPVAPPPSPDGSSSVAMADTDLVGGRRWLRARDARAVERRHGHVLAAAESR